MENATHYNDFTKLKKIDSEFIDESSELIQQWYKYYGKKFLESDIATLSLSEKQREELPFILGSFCDFCYSYHLQKPGQWTIATIKDVCTNIMPRKVMADERFFCAIVPVLYHFLTWMASENYMPMTDSLKHAILSIELEIVNNSKNSNNWGIGKSLMMGAVAKGYDVQNPQAIKAALTYENADELLTSAAGLTKNCKRLPKQADEIKTLEDIANDLRYLTLGFPKAAIQAALERQNEITPILFNFLNEAIERYQSLEDSYMGHLYAMFLLAQFREKPAFPFIIKVASLPEDAPDIILGDSITEDLHKIIASVYNNDLAAIQHMIENITLCTWSRNAAIKSLLTLVKERIVEREGVIQYFKELFNHPAFVEDEMAMTHLVNASCDLYPAELYNEIKTAFDLDRVDTSIVDMKWVDSILAMGQANVLKKYLTNHYEFIYDTIKEMQWWACFREQETPEHDIEVEFDEPGQIFSSHMPDTPYYRETPKVGRNDPCPCGNNKKFKKCCLTLH